MSPLPPDPDRSGHIDNAQALVRALANGDVEGALTMIGCLDRSELEKTTLYLGRGAAQLVLDARVEELDVALEGLQGVHDVKIPDGPAEVMKKHAAALDLAKRLIGHAVTSITARRNHLAGLAKEG